MKSSVLRAIHAGVGLGLGPVWVLDHRFGCGKTAVVQLLKVCTRPNKQLTCI